MSVEVALNHNLASSALTGRKWEHISDFSTAVTEDFLVIEVDDLKGLLRQGPSIATAIAIKTSVSSSGWWHQDPASPRKVTAGSLNRFYRDELRRDTAFMKYFFVDMAALSFDLILKRL